MRTFISRYSDIALAAMVIGIIGMLIIPLPTFVLDLLLTLNITLAVTLLMVSLYIPSALKIAAFPSILLITTLFRLALNVSSTRLILLQADAGQVIESFGNFVVQGNYIVGAVIFLILTLIQFLVIAKGSERVSEVAARFTLDAMPGKQMSIDADLRAGAFDLSEARRRRALVQKESQLYGAMDGAMKFVKGDAIAGIIMTAINIVAGIVIGVVQMEMGAGEAAKTYTLLTIGDGLVSQIPAILIATTSGIIVTRVASEEESDHLGADIFAQLMAQPKAIAIAATLVTLLALVPGLPTVPFLTMGAIVGLLAFGLFKSDAAGSTLTPAEAQQVQSVHDEAREGARQARVMIPALTPLSVDIGIGLSASLEGEGEKWLREMIPSMREGIFFERGVKVPGIRVRTESVACAPREFVISIDEVPIDTGQVPAERVLVNEQPSGLAVFKVEASATTHPVSGQPASWVEKSEAAALEEAGYSTWDEAGYILLRLTAALRKHAHGFVELQMVQSMLEQLEGPYPAAVQEVVPRLIGLQDLTEILRRLAAEGISLRNLPRVLQILAERARKNKDAVLLTEDVREGLRRYITHKYAGKDGSVIVYLMDREVEEAILGAIRTTEAGSFLAMAPDMTRAILQCVSQQVQRDVEAGRAPILLTDQRIRRFLKRLIALEVPNAVVLAYQELDPALKIQPLGRIGFKEGSR
ncbi:MAG: type III secretion system export apparatus subunit SctV [Bradymonadaceae bacterium]|nr:type III secretion system export apparatus subunit SctV [Lujinxingiaceae bacterium]